MGVNLDNMTTMNKNSHKGSLKKTVKVGKWSKPGSKPFNRCFKKYLGIIKKVNKFGPKLVTFTKVHKFKLVRFRKVKSLGPNLWAFERSQVWDQTCEHWSKLVTFQYKLVNFQYKLVTFQKVTSLDKRSQVFTERSQV